MVKKPNGKWRIYVDYTDLNKACPKDWYPLPTIDQLIDATYGHLMLSFMDAYAGYNKVLMAKEDIPKTAFITQRAVYAYRFMPFGIVNAGATYQRLMNKIFKGQLGRNMEVYVDDMIVKSLLAETHLEDLKECFENLRTYKMKLNPSKCTFGLTLESSLASSSETEGIEANPDKIKVVLEMKAPRTQKEVQKLTGCLAALRRFISKLAERCLPFFEILRGAKNSKCLTWTPECQEAFEGIKHYLVSPPILTKRSRKSLCIFTYLRVP